jgi:CheY-like chemotaxis protein
MSTGSSEGLRVLVADDNRDSADSCAILLLHDGHEVCVAYSGEDALAMGAKFRPHLILLDIGMPGMDGHAVARRIRALEWGSAAVLVAVTGFGQAEDFHKTRHSGFDHHFIKPVDFSLLQPVMKKCAHAHGPKSR